MSHESPVNKPTRYEASSREPWPAMPHARFADFPQGLATLGRFSNVIFKEGDGEDVLQSRQTLSDIAQEVIRNEVAVKEQLSILEGALDNEKLLASSISIESSEKRAESIIEINELEQSNHLTTTTELQSSAATSTTAAASNLEPTHLRFDGPTAAINSPSSAVRAAMLNAQAALDQHEQSLSFANAYHHSLNSTPSYSQLGKTFAPEVQQLVSTVAKSLAQNKSRVWQWHNVENHFGVGATTLWSWAMCWHNQRPERLLLIDATEQGDDLTSFWGWRPRSGLREVLADQNLLSNSLHSTDWSNIVLLPRGQANYAQQSDWKIRLQSMLVALQRDFPVIWVFTAGQWNSLSLAFAQAVHERQLLVRTNQPRVQWERCLQQMRAENIMLNGWLALEQKFSTQSHAA